MFASGLFDIWVYVGLFRVMHFTRYLILLKVLDVDWKYFLYDRKKRVKYFQWYKISAERGEKK